MSVKEKLLKKTKKYLQEESLSKLWPEAYAKAAQAPVNPRKVIFFEEKEKKCPDSYTIIMERLKRDYDFEVEVVCIGSNHVRALEYYKRVKAFLESAATAAYIFVSDSCRPISCVNLRPETKVIQLWHACGAFKKWGMSTADLKFGGSREALLRHPYYKNLSLVTVSSPEVEWAYVEAMVLEDTPEIVKPLGVSRTDMFFDQEFLQEARERLEAKVPAAAGKKIILYAPTFRGRVAKAKGPSKLDVASFRQRYKDDYVLLIKQHPFVKKPPKVPSECKDFAFDVTKKLPIEVLISCADVCISDYSSLVFEYSLFEKPMLFFAYDKDEYDSWRGFYYDYNELTPGPVVTTNIEMIDYIDNLDTRFNVEEVRAFKQKFMSGCDGHATDRIMAEVFGEEGLRAHAKKQLEQPAAPALAEGSQESE